MESAERSFSLVKGGISEYAAALAWEKKGAFPGHTVFTNWLESTKDNPMVIDFEVKKNKNSIEIVKLSSVSSSSESSAGVFSFESGQ